MLICFIDLVHNLFVGSKIHSHTTPDNSIPDGIKCVHNVNDYCCEYCDLYISLRALSFYNNQVLRIYIVHCSYDNQIRSCSVI